MDKHNELKKNTFVFAIGIIGTKAIQFFLVPLYTSFLSVSEYGLADIITSSVSLILPLLTLGIGNGILRFVLDQQENRKSVLKLALIICVFGTVFLFFSLPLIKKLQIFGSFSYFLPILFFLSSIKDSLASFCKALGMNKIYALDGVVSSLALISSAVFFISFKRLGTLGFLISSVISHCISIIFLFCFCNINKYLVDAHINKTLSREVLQYSIPLMPNGIFWWIIQMSDRYMVLWFCGAAANGIYSISYKIPSLFNLVVSIFIQAFGISAIKECNQQDVKQGVYDGAFFSEVYNQYTAISFITAGIVLIISRPLAFLIIKKEFYSAWKYIPFLLCAYLIGNFQSFYGSIFSGIKKTKSVLISTISGAIINVILNYVLIKRLQVYGAIISTIVSYSVVYIVRWWIIRNYVKMEHFFLRNIISIAVYILMCLTYLQENSRGILFSVIGFFLLLIIYRENINKLCSKFLFFGKKKNKQNYD